MKYITRSVWILSLVSLFTDVASEMLYPIMPIYLKSIGFSIVLIGLLEGVAESIAGLSKGYFGKLSDKSGKRVPFVQLGYLLSGISKPMLAFFINPLWIFFVRTIDRFGKGIRTGARDAILSEESTSATKGKVFGFHRSMDTFGAALGPALALIYLYYNPGNYVSLFYIAFLPGLLAILLSILLKEKGNVTSMSKFSISFFSSFSYWKSSPIEFRKLAGGLLVFTLFNSSDVFLLLKAKQSGLDDAIIIAIYIFYNLVYALAAFPAGILADKIGMKRVFILGLALFSIVYLGMASVKNTYIYFGLFLVYGLYAATTEGISKAWISMISDKKDIATALGTYSGFQSICTLLASSMTGLIWYKFGVEAAFVCTGVASIAVSIYFFFFVSSPKMDNSNSQA
ncbi:MAG: MFS transporter [Bacteroidia bacterium]|nr:MFS transporter [Bacteroidia bacterium]